MASLLLQNTKLSSTTASTCPADSIASRRGSEGGRVNFGGSSDAGSGAGGGGGGTVGVGGGC
jgi:hypothetical protein